MSDALRFDDKNYEVKECELDGCSIVYRAFEGINYCTNPADPIQKLNLFVPEAYYQGETLNGYTLSTAPVFVPNTVGVICPARRMNPDGILKDRSMQRFVHWSMAMLLHVLVSVDVPAA